VRFQYILCLSFISYVPFVSSFLRVRYTCIYIHFFRSALWTFCMLQVKILPSYSDRLRRIEKAPSLDLPSPLSAPPLPSYRWLLWPWWPPPSPIWALVSPLSTCRAVLESRKDWV
jgi:hypothetical protein